MAEGSVTLLSPGHILIVDKEEVFQIEFDVPGFLQGRCYMLFSNSATGPYEEMMQATGPFTADTNPFPVSGQGNEAEAPYTPRSVGNYWLQARLYDDATALDYLSAPVRVKVLSAQTSGGGDVGGRERPGSVQA